MKKRLLAFALLVTIAVSLLPPLSLSVFAEPAAKKTVTLGTSGLSNGDNIYMGNQEYTNEPVKWRVLSTEGNGGTYKDYLGNAYNDKAMFIITEDIFGERSTPREEDIRRYSWHESGEPEYCESVASSIFSVQEQKYLLKTSKTDVKSDPLTDERVFYISESEANNSNYFANSNDRKAKYDGNFYNWMLRSSEFLDEADSYGVSTVHTDGTVGRTMIDYSPNSLGARPALNLNMSKILFTTAPNGKDTDNLGLKQSQDYDEKEYKLTMFDNERTFRVTDSSVSSTTGNEISLNYINAAYGENEYISA